MYYVLLLLLFLFTTYFYNLQRKCIQTTVAPIQTTVASLQVLKQYSQLFTYDRTASLTAVQQRVITSISYMYYYYLFIYLLFIFIIYKENVDNPCFIQVLKSYCYLFTYVYPISINIVVQCLFGLYQTAENSNFPMLCPVR